MDGTNDPKALLQGLYAEMAPQHLFPLWEVLHALVTPVPASPVRPHLWHYDTARSHLLRAGDLITAEQAERRVLILENPGLPGTSSVTTSLYAGLQLILPGEVAPCHRHTQCALRFVMEGDGAFTALDGEKAVMRPFDLVLTPNWQWHDHGNASAAPMIWLDGLDIPTVRHFAASFAERLPDGALAHAETAPPGDTAARYGRNLRPFGGSLGARRPAGLPLFHYPYAEWRDSLAAMARNGDPDPHLGHALEFVNPADGGPVMPTIAAHVRLLPAGFATLPRRATDAMVLVVVEGAGLARINGHPFPLGPRDLLVVPSWAALEVSATSEMVVFGYSDAAAQQKLGLWREQRMQPG
ncbi:gentisate 1,2-dioxygenase [Falsiroseomonas selenitidurans]|uniref:Gentisate 1,2-dioxygenase n=1 Tax=Falsiroseomonas selenitidurans TaxID=2716335 RepID=A0ABX1E5S0_9PROT|nr:gentisate 1,2-dioxygenase [Falsiroseomonas selenitidurans]NKC32316.1 gentisate 1,2-dioxygenase [Falsiroseomonas selenitidurans]